MKTKDLILKIQEMDLEIARLKKLIEASVDPIDLNLVAEKASKLINVEDKEAISDSHISKIAKIEIKKHKVDELVILSAIKKHVNLNFVNNLYRGK